MSQSLKLIWLSLVCVSFVCRANELAPGHTPDWTKLLDRTIKVEAVLLDHDFQKGTITERTERQEVGKGRSQKLIGLLKADRNWENPLSKLCLPNYGARLIFYVNNPTANDSKKISKLRVDLCFQCD